MILKIKSLNVSSFRDLGDNQAVTFKDSGIYSITGENLDDGGSNGSGKTSLVMSMIAGFFGSKGLGISAKELKNRHTDTKPSIEIELEIDGQPHTISRVIGGKVKLDGVEGSADDIQEKINHLIKLTPEQFKALSFKEQGDAGGFLLLPDGEKKEFLSSFFNLDVLSNASENVNKEYTAAKQKQASLEVMVREKKYQADSAFGEVQRALARLDHTAEIDKRIAQYQVEIAELNQKCEEFKAQLVPTPNSVIHTLNEQIEKIKQAIANAEKELEAQRNRENVISVLRNKADVNTKHMATLKANRCVTCDQEINVHKVHELQQSLGSELRKIHDEIAGLEASSTNGDRLKQNIQALKEMKDRHINKLNEERLRGDKSQIKMALGSTQKSIATLENLIQSELRAKANARSDYERSVDYHNAKLAEIIKVEADHVSSKADIALLESLDKILSKNGFMGYIFDTVLEELNYETNANLSNIPNAAKFTLQFNSDKIAKSTGNVTKAITFKLFSNGEEVSIDSLSGGEKRSLIIAVDEALDSVLSKRTGTMLNWKFLDEPFDSIDINSKEALLEFYKLKSHNRLYFIIDHASELNAGLDNSIRITKKNGIATIQ